LYLENLVSFDGFSFGFDGWQRSGFRSTVRGCVVRRLSRARRRGCSTVSTLSAPAEGPYPPWAGGWADSTARVRSGPGINAAGAVVKVSASCSGGGGLSHHRYDRFTWSAVISWTSSVIPVCTSAAATATSTGPLSSQSR